MHRSGVRDNEEKQLRVIVIEKRGQYILLDGQDTPGHLGRLWRVLKEVTECKENISDWKS